VLVSSVTLTAVRREREVAPPIVDRVEEEAPTPPFGVPPTPTEPEPPGAGPSRAARRPVARKPTRTAIAPGDPAPANHEAPAGAPLQADAAGTEPEMQKIEMQTSDPNIRIIWFAPKQEGAGLGRS
jgi:hypothetical protein